MFTGRRGPRWQHPGDRGAVHRDAAAQRRVSAAHEGPPGLLPSPLRFSWSVFYRSAHRRNTTVGCAEMRFRPSPTSAALHQSGIDRFVASFDLIERRPLTPNIFALLLRYCGTASAFAMEASGNCTIWCFSVQRHLSVSGLWRASSLFFMSAVRPPCPSAAPSPAPASETRSARRTRRWRRCRSASTA